MCVFTLPCSTIKHTAYYNITFYTSLHSALVLTFIHSLLTRAFYLSIRFLQGFYKAVVGSIIPPANIASATEVTTEDPPPVAKPDFNTTFIKDTTDTQVVATTTPLSKSASVDEYEMTPMESDPIIVCDNYNIQDLSSDDSTDDEDCPKKVL